VDCCSLPEEMGQPHALLREVWVSSDGSATSVDDVKVRLLSILSAGSFVPPKEANESYSSRKTLILQISKYVLVCSIANLIHMTNEWILLSC
jgi:hypothetical protein